MNKVVPINGRRYSIRKVLLHAVNVSQRGPVGTSSPCRRACTPATPESSMTETPGVYRVKRTSPGEADLQMQLRIAGIYGGVEEHKYG